MIFLCAVLSKDDLIDKVWSPAYDLPVALYSLLEKFSTLTETVIPAQFMSRYCNGRGTRTSLEAVKEINSSTAKTSIHGGKKMNQFQYNLSTAGRPS